MKKIICFTVAILLTLWATLSVAAVDTDDTAEDMGGVLFEEQTAAETDSSPAEDLFETAADEGESFMVIDDTMSLSEAILAIAASCGISVSEAERVIEDIRVIGDRYLGESDLWVRITADMEEHPAKWTLIGALLLLVLFLIGVLIKRVISDATTSQRMKISLENLDKAINGDERDENGRALSIRAMISEKNGQIELLEKENGELKAKAEELTAVVESLNSAISKVEVNSDTTLKLTEEAALQIMQLINIAMDRKVPITSKEARQIWYEHTQNRIKTIYESGTTEEDQRNGEREDAAEAGQTV